MADVVDIKKAKKAAPKKAAAKGKGKPKTTSKTVGKAAAPAKKASSKSTGESKKAPPKKAIPTTTENIISNAAPTRVEAIQEAPSGATQPNTLSEKACAVGGACAYRTPIIAIIIIIFVIMAIIGF